MWTQKDSPISMASYLTVATYFLSTSIIWSSKTLSPTVVSPPDKCYRLLDQQPACDCEWLRETFSDGVDSDSDCVQFNPIYPPPFLQWTRLHQRFQLTGRTTALGSASPLIPHLRLLLPLELKIQLSHITYYPFKRFQPVLWPNSDCIFVYFMNYL